MADGYPPDYPWETDPLAIYMLKSKNRNRGPAREGSSPTHKPPSSEDLGETTKILEILEEKQKITPRERRVYEMSLCGMGNVAIGRHFDISAVRARQMGLKVHSWAEGFRMGFNYQCFTEDTPQGKTT